MDFLHKIEAVIILDSAGQRVFAKYFPVYDTEAVKGGRIEAATSAWATVETQHALETAIHAKAHSSDRPAFAYACEGDILVHENHTVLFEAQQELTFFVVGGGRENELVLSAVLNCLLEALQELLKCHGAIDRRTLLDNYDILLLIVDEMIDDGVIFEISASAVIAEVEPFLLDAGTENAKKAISTFGKYIKNM